MASQSNEPPFKLWDEIILDATHWDYHNAPYAQSVGWYGIVKNIHYYNNRWYLKFSLYKNSVFVRDIPGHYKCERFLLKRALKHIINGVIEGDKACEADFSEFLRRACIETW